MTVSIKISSVAIALVICTILTSARHHFSQSVTRPDVYIVQGSRYLEVSLNDENPAGYIWWSPPHSPYVAMTCTGLGCTCPNCFYVTPPGNTIMFDMFGYQYISQQPPIPDSNVSLVGMIFIGDSDDQNAGRNCSGAVGKPVNVTNGNMYLQQLDYSLPGLGEPTEINRFYNSIIQRAGLFGHGWSTKFDESLQIYGDKMIRYNESDGRASYFGRFTTSDPYTSYSSNIVAQIVHNVGGTYTLTLKDGRSRTFNSAGRLLSMSDTNGNTTTLTYNSSGLLTTITDSVGRAIELTPNTDGTISQISDAIGTIASYEYFPGTTQLKTVSYPDGAKYKFEYNSTAVTGKVFLASVKDVYDNILETHDYDSQGRATTSEVHGGVEKYTLQYTTDGSGSPLTIVTTQTFPTETRQTKFWYRRENGTNLVTKTEGECGCGGGGSEVTQFEYDYRLNLIKKTDALGRQTLYTYDGDRNPIVVEERSAASATLGIQRWTYNSRGQVLTYKDRADQGTSNDTAAYVYDTNGNMTSYTDAMGKVTTATYTTSGLPATVTDARNNTTTLGYDSQGRLTTVTDDHGKVTSLGHDARARITSVTNAKSETTSFTYDLKDRPKRTTFPDLNYIEHTYDLGGRRTATRDERGNSTTFAWDNAYRLTSVTDPLNHSKTFGYDLMSNLISQTDALGNTTEYEYDDFDRLKKIIYPPATTGSTRLEEAFTYDKLGNLKTRTDTAARTTTYNYDELNRLASIVDPMNNTTAFTHDLRFHLTKVKDALNQEYIFTYDPLGRRLSRTRAGATETFAYDEVGNRIGRTDFNGRVTEYAYDDLNRLATITYVDSSDYAQFAYDDLSRLLSATNQNGTVAFTYDNRGRLKTETDVFGHVTERSYDAAGNRTQLKLDSGVHTSYSYDAAGRLVTLTDDANQTYTYGYDIANRLISKAFPNGVTTTLEYDGMSRIKRLKDATTAATLFDRQYSHNAAGQISGIVEPSRTRAFGYDSVDRLISATDSVRGNEMYAYDAVGNRTASHLGVYAIGGFNRISQSGPFAVSHDDNGNMVGWVDTQGAVSTEPWGERGWDFENRLTLIDVDGEEVTYGYDALGRRVSRTLDGRASRFTHDGEDVVLDEGDGGTVKYQNGPGVDDKLSLKRGSGVKYFLQDHLGSTVGLADAAGAVVEQNSYDSFGNPSTPNFSTRYQFTGREFDRFTGLQYSRARWYHPGVGRFISEDPIGFAGGDINLYAYVWNNPVDFTDSMGLYPSWNIFNYHKTITERALQGRADPRDIRMLADAQYPHDSATQDSAYAPWHAMARPFQNPEDARREANFFVRNRICLAKELSRRGFQADAMAYLAQAIHAMQDHASPQHHPFKRAWPDTFWDKAREYLSPFGHIQQEAFDPGMGSAADENTRAVYDYYIGNRPMPRDLFNNAYDLPGVGVRYSPYRAQ